MSEFGHRSSAGESGHVRHPFSCHGCKNTVYSAAYGQLPLKPRPHSRCGALNRDITMVLGPHQKWLASEVPEDCPVPVAQRERALTVPRGGIPLVLESSGCGG